MPKIFYRKKFSDYLGEPRALNDIIGLFTQAVVPTPTPTPSVTPTNTPTPSVTATITPSPTITPTNTQTPTLTPTITPTSTPAASLTPTPTNTVTPSITPTNTNTPTPSTTTTLTPTPTNTVTPTNTQTPTNTLTPTPSSTPSTPPDADATAYLNAVIATGGTLNPTISAATYTLFEDLKTAGLYSKMTLMYPMLGSIASSIAINAINPSTYRIGWNGTSTFNYSGVTFNGNDYGNLGLYADDAILNNNDVHTGVYLSKVCTGCANEVEFGGTTAASSYEGGFIFPLGQIPAYKVLYYNGLSRFNWPNDNLRYAIANKTGTTVNFWENSVKYVEYTSVTTKAAEHQLQMLGCWYIDGNTAYYHSTKGISFFHIGTSLSDSEASNLSSIINDFQTAISRNIYS